MERIKPVLYDWMPPSIIRWVNQRRSTATRFRGPFATWGEASANSTGYDADRILQKVLAATLKVRNGEAQFERDSVLFYKPDFVWPLLSGLLWTAARHGGRLNVLGG